MYALEQPYRQRQGVGVEVEARSQALRGAKGTITDEASAVEQMGLKPRLVPGSRENLKVTWPEDLAIAQSILSRRRA